MTDASRSTPPKRLSGFTPEQRPCTSDADPCAALEVFIDHVARLVLHAQALADRCSTRLPRPVVITDNAAA